MRWLLVALLAACSEKAKSEPVPAPVTQPKSEPPRRDGGVLVQSPSGMHLDDDVSRHPAVEAPLAHAGRAIDVTLRSSPTGAQAAVDAGSIGITPTFWAGQADGREHEFTFDLRGYALSRYRFVPV